MTIEAHLTTFLAVCDAKGFGRAARRLGTSQPAVSYRIRQLEAALGAAVIERGAGRFQLTAAGRRLAEVGTRFVGEVRSLGAQVAEQSPELDGPLRIATVSGFGRYVLFPALVGLGLGRLECYYRTAEEVVTLLRDGHVDLGFVYTRLPSRTLQFRPIYREELVLIVPRTERRWSRVDWSGGGGEAVPFVTYEEHDYVFGRWFDAVVGTQPSYLGVVAHFDELEETIDGVAAGWGVSIVPEDAARRFGGKRVRAVRPGRARCFNDVYAVEPARPLRPAIARAAEQIGKAIG